MAGPYAGKQGRVRFTSATATSSTDNAGTLSTDGVTLSIDSTAKIPWNRGNSTALKVFHESTAVSSTQWDLVNWLTGTVRFTTAWSTADTYTLDVETLSASYLGDVRGWSADVDYGMADVTTFSTSTADAQFRKFVPTLGGGTVTLNRVVSGDSTSFFAFDRLNADQDVVLELVADGSTGDILTAFGRVSRDSLSDPVDGIVGEDVEVQLDGNIVFSTR